MRYFKYSAIVTFLLLSAFGTAAAQSSGDKMISPGYIAGGGGTSTAGDKIVIGLVPLAAPGYSSSGQYVTSSGTIAATFISGAPLVVDYAGAPEEIVPKANKVISVTYAGGTGEATGKFYYREGGESAYSMAPMTPGDGDALEYEVTADILGIRGLEYYVEVSRSSSSAFVGSAADPYAFVVELNNAQAQRPDLLEDGKYRIIGLPIDVTSPNGVSNVFADDLGGTYKEDWRLGSYTSAGDTVIEYPDAVDVTPGRGYWLIMKTAKSYGAAGVTMRPNFEYGGKKYYSLPLDTAWNQLANPLPFDVAWDDVIFDTGGVVVTGHPMEILEDAAHWYNGTSYSTATTIPTWDGVFVYVLHPDLTAHFPYAESVKSANKPWREMAETESAGEWSVHIQLEANGLIDDGNFAGVRTDAQTGPDYYDFSEPPVPPNAPFMAFRLPESESRLRRCDYRPPFSDGAKWDIEFSLASGRSIEITGLDRIPQDMAAILALDNGNLVDLTDGIRMKLQDEIRSAVLGVGTKEYLADGFTRPLPDNYALEQNYPNPFNPMTRIRFALPVEGDVNLTVFNILGRHVRTLRTGHMDAGYHTVTWDGKDEGGKSVASGIYFYRMTSGKFSECRKMIVLK